MAFLVSPGVQVKETDLTNIVPAVATSIGGFAGRFEWGPVNEVTLISSEQDLLNKHGRPLGPLHFVMLVQIPSSQILLRNKVLPSFCQ